MISIVIPVFNEEKRLYENISEIVSVIKEYDYEVILIDDGSKDTTWEIVKRLFEENNRIKGVRFSRNFGKELALCAGLENANGELVITMDSDLQHPPKYIHEMVGKWKEGYKIVECKKAKRARESFFNKIFAGLFYKTINKFTGFNMTNATDFKLLDRQVVDDINRLKEGQVFFRGLVEWIGYDKYEIPIVAEERKGDTSKFNFISLIRLALNAVTSFSSSILYITIILGAVFFMGAIILAIQTIINKIMGTALSGFTTVILLQLIIGASVLLCLGIIGIYIAKIYNEVKQRPRYIISEVLK